MIRKISVYFSLMALILAANCVKIDEIENVKLKSEATLKNLIQAVEMKDSAGAAKLFSDSAEEVLIIPAVDSILVGDVQIKAALEKLFSQIDSIKIKPLEMQTFPAADLESSRFAAACDVKIKKTGGFSRYRALASGMLVKNVGIWNFTQLHISVTKNLKKTEAAAAAPAPDQKESEKLASPGAAAKVDSVKNAKPDTTGGSY